MARPRSNSPKHKGKGTSFGKRSDAEKTFRKRKISSRSGRSDTPPSGGGFGSRSRDDKPKTFRAGGAGFRKSDEGAGKAPYRRSPGTSFGSDKPGFRPGGKSFRPRPDGDDRGVAKRPYGKREGGSFPPGQEGPPRFAKPFRAGGDEEKRSFRKTDGAPFGSRPERGGFKKTFRKTDGFSKSPRTERADGDQESKPYRKPSPKADISEFKRPSRKSDSFPPPPREEGNETGDGRENKPYPKKEHKSFVQSRVVTSAEFVKPGRKVAAPVTETSNESGLTRLNKYIANSGVGSRREADELIKMGLISINGTTVTTLGTKVKVGDIVRYEDRILKAEKPVYILLNKPKGFITTTEDPQERNTVMGLVAGACKERIYPVGRLDRNTTGLLLLTNDGDLADKLTHPSYKAKKVYKAELDRPLTKNDFKKILEGVHLEEGKAMVDDLAIISEDDKTVGLEIHIGWNRVVRRIFESLGYDVVKLDRSVFAGLDKKDLSRGQWRFLKPEEIVRLKHFK